VRRWRFSSSGAPRLCNDALARVEQCDRISEFLLGDALHFVHQVTDGGDIGRERSPHREAVRDRVRRIGFYDRSGCPGQAVCRPLVGDDSDDSGGWTPLLDRRGDAANERRVSHRHVHHIDRWQLFDDLYPDGRSSDRDVGISGIVQKKAPLDAA